MTYGIRILGTDGGTSKFGLESTIVSLINKPQILRLGCIEVNKIRKEWGIDTHIYYKK